MTKGGRIAGGIMAIAGGAFILITAIVLISVAFLESLIWISVIMTMLCGVLALVGGILLCVDKTAGGILAIIGGAFCIVGSFIPIIGIFSLTEFFFSFWIDPAIALVGGIVGLAVGSEL